MKLSTNTNVLSKLYGLKQAVAMLADAGFHAADFSAFSSEEYYTDAHDQEFYEEIRVYAADRGLCFNQAHAPYPSSYAEPEKTEQRFWEIVASMKHAAWLGVPYIIVHPCQHLNYHEPGVPERLYDINMAFYRRLIPYCEEYQIKIAVENMWQYPGMISHSTCSRPAEFLRYLQGLDEEHFVACLDTGHAMLVREKPADLVYALGGNWLQCLHVHDVDGIHDSHDLPFRGIIDWDSVMKALAEIGYGGDMTFETTGCVTKFPKELHASVMKQVADVGHYLIKKFEEYRV